MYVVCISASSMIGVLGIVQFRPPIALASHITTELWEISVFYPADGAMIVHMIKQHYFSGVIISLRAGAM